MCNFKSVISDIKLIHLLMDVRVSGMESQYPAFSIFPENFRYICTYKYENLKNINFENHPDFHFPK